MTTTSWIIVGSCVSIMLSLFVWVVCVYNTINRLYHDCKQTDMKVHNAKRYENQIVANIQQLITSLINNKMYADMVKKYILAKGYQGAVHSGKINLVWLASAVRQLGEEDLIGLARYFAGETDMRDLLRVFGEAHEKVLIAQDSLAQTIRDYSIYINGCFISIVATLSKFEPWPDPGDELGLGTLEERESYPFPAIELDKLDP